VQQPALSLVQRAAAEAVVRRAVLVGWVARHCSRRRVEEVGRSIGGDAASECGRPGAVGRDI
jgi:hypothetical protein